MKKLTFQICVFFFMLNFSAFTQKIDFKKQIWPIIQDKCLDCHNDQNKHPQRKKPKSGLQMDTPEMIMKGGGNGPIIVPGKPLESPMYSLSALPEDHEDVMPPKGELLTKAQLATVKKWIEEGADFGVKLKKYTAPVKKASEMNIYDIVGEKVPKPKEDAIKHFQSKKYFIQPVQEGNNLLKLDFLAQNSLNADDFRNIKKLSPQLVYVNLARTNVQDRDLAALSSCKNLKYLHLEKTAISDKGLSSLAGVQSLEYLNLYSTSVTDKGIKKLASLKNLKSLYLWQTKVSKNGAAQLSRALPGLKINLGD